MTLHKTLLAVAVSLAFAGAAVAGPNAPLPKELPAYAPDRPLPVADIAQKTLANGMTVWVVPRDGLPRVDYVLAVRDAGYSADAADAPGFASMLATVIYVIFFLPDRMGHMGEVLRDLFEKPDQWRLESGPDVLALFMRLGWEVGNLLLHLDRKETPTLKHVSLTVQPGEKVGIVGRSGSGKSTLLRALAGLHHPDEGHVLIDGVAVTAYAPEVRMRCIGFKPQEPFLFDGTVAANIFVGDRVPGQVYEAALAVSSLDDLIARGELRLDQVIKAPGNLSGGQRQLAGLAQAVVRDPRLLLLDEPTSALDLKHQIEVMRLLRDLAGEGRIVVVVLHDITLAARWADEVVLLDRGALHSAGAPTATLTAGALAAVYGVIARVEQGADGFPQIIVADTIR